MNKPRHSSYARELLAAFEQRERNKRTKGMLEKLDSSSIPFPEPSLNLSSTARTSLEQDLVDGFDRLLNQTSLSKADKARQRYEFIRRLNRLRA